MTIRKVIQEHSQVIVSGHASILVNEKMSQLTIDQSMWAMTHGMLDSIIRLPVTNPLSPASCTGSRPKSGVQNTLSRIILMIKGTLDKADLLFGRVGCQDGDRERLRTQIALLRTNWNFVPGA